MSVTPYEKTVWENGDYILAERMNKIEDGIDSATTAVSNLEATTVSTAEQILTEQEKENVRNNIDAVDTSIKKSIQDLQERNSINIIAGLPHEDYSIYNVSFTFDDTGACTISTTARASRVAYYNYFQKSDEFPMGMVPGGTYQLDFTTPSTTYIRLLVQFCINGVFSGQTLISSTTITVPENATGCYIALQVSQTAYFSTPMTVNPCLWSSPTNAELQNMITENTTAMTNQIDQITSILTPNIADVDYLKITDLFQGKQLGLSYERVSDTTLKLWGTYTRPILYFYCFNGQRTLRTYIGSFSKTLDAGTYQMSLEVSGPIVETNSNWSLTSTTSEKSTVVISKTQPSQEVQLDAEAMIGLTLEGTEINCGTEDTPSFLVIRAKKITTVDQIAHKEINNLQTAIGVEKIENWVNGYIPLNNRTETQPYEPFSIAGWRCALISCVPDEYFTISGQVSSQTKLWGFLDASYKILDTADTEFLVTNNIIKAPATAAWLVINDITNTTNCYRGIAVQAGLTSVIKPILNTQQKQEIQQLCQDYLDNASRFEYAYGHTSNDWADYTGAGTQASPYKTKALVKIDENNQTIWKINCNTLVQNIWMGRNVSDYIDKTSGTFSVAFSDVTNTNIYTPYVNQAFDWGYFCDFPLRALLGNLVPDNSSYYGYVQPEGTDVNSYSINSYYSSTSTNAHHQVFKSFLAANDLARRLWEIGCEIPAADMDIGDLVFTKSLGPVSDTDLQFFYDQACWRNISHVMIVIDKTAKGLPIFLESADSPSTGYIRTLEPLKWTQPSDNAPANIIQGLNWGARMQSICMVARHPVAYGKNNMHKLWKGSDTNSTMPRIPYIATAAKIIADGNTTMNTMRKENYPFPPYL